MKWFKVQNSVLANSGMQRFASLLAGVFVLASVWGCLGPVTPGMRGPGHGYDVVSISPSTIATLSAQALEKKRARMERNLENHQPIENVDYKIGVGDLLFIKLWEREGLRFSDQMALNNEQSGTLVDGNGEIYYPYVERIKVAGKTVGEVRQLLLDKLATYFKQPKVDVSILEYRSQKAFVTGEVKEPGALSITQEPLSVRRAVQEVGGLLPSADRENAVILSEDGGRTPVDLQALYFEDNISSDILMRSGDTLHVPDNHRNLVFLMGEIEAPQVEVIPAGQLSLAEAIVKASGVNARTSAPSNIYVIRGVVKYAMLDPAGNASAAEIENAFSETKIYHLNAKHADAMALADHFMLQPRDVVYVSTAGITVWARIVEQLIPTTISQYVNQKLLDM